MTTMDNVIIIESEDSENSIIEVEVPRKPTPPLILVEDEEIILNIEEKNEESILAKDFIESDKTLSVMSNKAESSKRLISPNHWTSDMIKFYDDDWGDEEDFIVEKLQEKMDKHPSLWDVSRKNRLLTEGNSRSHVKCWNCGQRGHHFTLCPEPPHVTKCHMCGTEGHAEYFCPNSICLNCGNHSREYVTCCFKCRNQVTEICSRCHMVGHNFINCPDHWRLFHLTTGTTSVRVPDRNIYKSDKDMWCCNCGRRGHYQIWCKKKKDCGGFKDSLPFVISYQIALNVNHPKNKPNDTSWKKSKGNRGREFKAPEAEKIFRLNPLNNAMRKDKMKLKNKLKRFNRNKKKQRQKRLKQGFFNDLLF